MGLAAVAGWLVFAGGLSAQGAGVNVTASPAANGNGWHNEPFTVTFNHAALTCDPPEAGYNGPDSTNPADLTSTCTDPADPDVLPPEIGTYPFKYDATPPTAAPNPPNGSGGWHTQPFNVALNWDAGVSGEAQGCPANVTYSGGLQNVTCTDLAGNTRTVPLEYLYDDGAPSISITSGPADGSVSQDRTPAFGFSSDDSTAQFSCEFDSGGFAPCNSPAVPSAALGDGPHTFRVFAVDQANNQSPTATRSWQIADLPTNTTLPTIVGFPEEGETLVADQGVWSGGTPPVTLTTHWQSCDASGGGCSEVATGNTYVIQATDVDRKLRVQVEASNIATSALGNPVLADSTLTGVVMALDPSRPQTTIVGRPRNPTNRQRATFTFESSRPGPNTSFQCKLDGRAFLPCASVSAQTYIGLSPGRHVFYVKAILQRTNDVLEDLSPAAWVWRIDLVPPPPPTSLVAKPGDGKVVLTWLTPRVADVAGTRIVRSKVGGFVNLDKVVTRSRFTDTTAKNGVYYRYALRTVDRAGNRSDDRVRRARPRDPLLAPRDGAIVDSNPLLRWLAKPHATYYNVQVYRVRPGADQKILTAWPTATRYQIPRRWFYRRWRTLLPGLYRWWVFPGYGRPEAEQYGNPVGTSLFTKR